MLYIARVKRAFLLLGAIAIVAVAHDAAAQQAVFLVRHAERADQSSDPPLSSAGRSRAERLAAMLAGAGITHVYTTDLRRTVETGAPVAERLHVPATALPAADRRALLDSINASTSSDRLLIVGHSNTLPDILAALGVTPAIAIRDDDYDNLFLVIPRTGAPPVFIRMRF
jgi:broad specificity phosphatase PhoE